MGLRRTRLSVTTGNPDIRATRNLVGSQFVANIMEMGEGNGSLGKCFPRQV